MLGPVMRQMAALAERGEIALVIVARIMVEMRAGEHDLCTQRHHLARQLNHAQLLGKAIRREKPPHPPTAIVAPAPALLIIPAAVAKMANLHAMRPAAVLTLSFGTLKPDKGGQLAPVDRV